MSRTASSKRASPAVKALSDRAMFSHRPARSSTPPSNQPERGHRAGGGGVGVKGQRGVLVRGPLHRFFQVRLADIGERHWETKRYHLLDQLSAGVENRPEPRRSVPLDGGGRLDFRLDDERLSAVMLDQDVGAESRVPANDAGLLGGNPPSGVPPPERLGKNRFRAVSPVFGMFLSSSVDKYCRAGPGSAGQDALGGFDHDLAPLAVGEADFPFEQLTARPQQPGVAEAPVGRQVVGVADVVRHDDLV